MLLLVSAPSRCGAIRLHLFKGDSINRRAGVFLLRHRYVVAVEAGAQSLRGDFGSLPNVRLMISRNCMNDESAEAEATPTF